MLAGVLVAVRVDQGADLFGDPIAPQVRVLGSGQFGAVYLAKVRDIEEPGRKTLAAVKTLHEDEMVTDLDRVDFIGEMAVMVTLHHPHVLRLHGLVTETTPMMIILEFMSEGSLEDVLAKEPLAPALITQFASDVRGYWVSPCLGVRVGDPAFGACTCRWPVACATCRA